jgi:hypothetical protein
MTTLASGPNTLGALQAMQAIILNETLVGGVSPFAALSASDQTRYGVTRAVFIGRPKDFADAYLPQCALWIPERDEREQPVELVGHTGRVFDDTEVTIQCFCDLRRDWWAAEQQILQIRDALWPVLLKHLMLGGTVATVTEADAYEGRGLCYEEIGGIQYRCYEAVWAFMQQWSITGGVTQ